MIIKLFNFNWNSKNFRKSSLELKDKWEKKLKFLNFKNKLNINVLYESNMKFTQKKKNIVSITTTIFVKQLHNKLQLQLQTYELKKGFQT